MFASLKTTTATSTNNKTNNKNKWTVLQLFSRQRHHQSFDFRKKKDNQSILTRIKNTVFRIFSLDQDSVVVLSFSGKKKSTLYQTILIFKDPWEEAI